MTAGALRVGEPRVKDDLFEGGLVADVGQDTEQGWMRRITPRAFEVDIDRVCVRQILLERRYLKITVSVVIIGMGTPFSIVGS